MLQYLDTIIAFAVIMLGLSLLITLLNQTVSSFLSYRGTNLRWGIETMLTTLDPALAQQARNIANRVLTDPIISDSIAAKFNENMPVVGRFIQRWKLASAIGPDALVRTLTRVANAQTDPAIAATIKQILGQVDPETERKLRMIYEAFELPATSSTEADGVKYAVQVDDLLKQLGNSVQQSVGRIEAWFNIVMNRVTQRFTMQIRIWTVIFAFLLAFGIQLDSFNLFNQLLGNPALRQKVLDQSGAMLNEAGAIMGTETSAPVSETNEPTTSPEVLNGKMKELRDKDVNKETEATPELLGTIPGFNKFSEAENWLREKGLKPEVPKERKDQLATKYRGYVILGLKEKAKDVTAILQKTGIELVPGDRTLADLKNNPLKFFFPFEGVRKFLGVLLTAGMLALGAPFWYNALKTLTNLRPMVATRQEKQKQQAAAT